jgi:RNA polymerase sigma-70 factor (ECF subfamily)
MSGDAELDVADVADLGRHLEQHRRSLHQMVRRRIDPALAVRIDPEEILHEAFLVACRRWPSYKANPTVSPYAWLYRIVLDTLIEVWRRESRLVRDLRRDLPWPVESSVQLALRLVEPAAGPSSALARDEMLELVKRTVESLAECDHEILWMRHYDQLSFKEAASVLGISENAATVRYARALKRLRDKWLQTVSESDA